MHVRNKTDRYHIAIDVVDKLSSTGAIPHDMAANLIKKYQHKLAANTEYIKIHGVDLDEISSWRWTR
jgi:xylulose-5-phosphate/fructose-6-phosphate phosphoketolase